MTMLLNNRERLQQLHCLDSLVFQLFFSLPELFTGQAKALVGVGEFVLPALQLLPSIFEFLPGGLQPMAHPLLFGHRSFVPLGNAAPGGHLLFALLGTLHPLPPLKPQPQVIFLVLVV